MSRRTARTSACASSRCTPLHAKLFEPESIRLIGKGTIPVLGYGPHHLTDMQRDVVVGAVKDPSKNIFIASEYLAQLKARAVSPTCRRNR
ncbi:hypothetical protein [Streptomyces actinomycinicus]|uniref:hypothetical protein n=1 Tax=Streptomyces actinomycinicus TaxID=1695166 RepID=UPI001F422BBC|nr:hypothetical protein [Streptomyces actinomycinicus]